MSQTIPNALWWWARMQPDVLALSLEGDAVTYRDYWAWIERIAARLQDQGIAASDRVAICAPNSLDYCALAMGIVRIGAIVVPVSTRYTLNEVAEIVGDTTPRAIFTDAAARERLQGLALPVIDLAEIAALRHGAPASVEFSTVADAPVVIISTSGSTAKPKGVVMTNRSMTAYAAEFGLQEPLISKGARILVLAPLSTSAGFVQLVHYTVLGCTIFMEPAFEAKRGLQILVENRINAFGGVPVLFERIAALPEFPAADLSQLRFVTVGGARVSRALLDSWLTKGITIRQIYGQTEVGGNATIMPEALAATAPEKCGWGGPFTEIRTRRADGSLCAAGETGEIVIRAPGMMAGYWNNPGATAETIRDGWLHTGDLGVLDEAGLLTFVDRMKDIIISGGLNISAAEVERAIAEFPGVEEVLVIAAPDPRFAETPMAVLYAPTTIDVPALIAHCNRCLADYKVPRYVVVESEPLPRLATHKLSKPAVRAKYKEIIPTLQRVR
jgi:fatty-acyl-CoA synthase